MKLLKQYSCEFDADDESKRLEKRGILTFVSSKQSRQLSSVFTGAVRSGLWVVLENQYEDAYRILNRKQCKVKHPLTSEQITEYKKSASVEAPQIILRFFGKVFAIIMGIALFAYLIYRVYGNA